MPEYLSIGKVAKLKNISIKSLRYYDSIGVLKPAFVNTQTNYRYYTVDQLYLLDAIDLCIKLGMPLRDLHKYVQDDSFNIQALLYDSKAMAEQQIRDIRTAMGQLQSTLQKLSSVSGMAKIPQSVRGVKEGTRKSKRQPKPITNVVHYGQRCLLMVPFDENDYSPKYCGQYILKLFVGAQQLGLKAGYPSGILHDYTGDSVRHFMFLELEEPVNIPDGSTESHGGSQELIIHHIPEANYYFKKMSAHFEQTHLPSHDTSELFRNLKTPFPVDDTRNFFLEIDEMDAAKKEAGYPYRLEIPLKPGAFAETTEDTALREASQEAPSEETPS